MLTPAVYPVRNALVELDSRIATAWHHPLHRSTLRESRLLPPFIRRNAPFELDSRIAGWPWPGITLSIPLP